MEKYTYENGWISVLDFVQIRVNDHIVTIIDVVKFISMEDPLIVEVEDYVNTLISAYIVEHCQDLKMHQFVFFSDIVELYAPEPQDADDGLELQHDSIGEQILVH